MNNIIHCVLLSQKRQERNQTWRTIKLVFVILFLTILQASAINKPNTKVISHSNYFTIIQVSGRVTDKTGGALPGVSVHEKGKTEAVSTDGNGNYQIKTTEGATLVFSYVGYKTKQVIVGGNAKINVTLEEDVNNLKQVEVVSTGFQNLNPKLFTGAATAIKGSDVKQEGITDVSRMLEGRIAGVSVQNVSGTFGAAPKMRIRGATSITGENKPLWVVDGVILEDIVNISNEQLSSGDASTLIGSSVAGLNADDIESFNILKDASATAQYGARAMNGVIVITTKKGRIGAPVVSYTGNFSTYLKPNYNQFDIMNSADQMSVDAELARKGWLNHAQAANQINGGVFTKMYQLTDTYDPITGTFALENTQEARSNFLSRYAKANTNWFDVLFKNSLLQEHAVSISSGTEKSQIYFSTSYLNDNGWAMGNKVERYTTNLNANFNLTKKLTVNFITTGSIRNQKAPNTVTRASNPAEGKFSRDFDINPFSYALNTSRTLTPFDENGNREFFTRSLTPFNILTELENNTLDLSVIDFKLQGGIKYNITNDLKFESLASLRYVKSTSEARVRENSNMANAYRSMGTTTIREKNNFLYRNPDNPALQPVSVLPYGGFYNPSDDFLKAYTVRNSLEFNKIVNEVHIMNFYVAQDIRISNRQNRSSTGYGYQYDKGGVAFIDPNAIKQEVEGNQSYYEMGNKYDRFAAFLARAAYSYNGKYSINGTVRYDGSNSLGKSITARWLPTWNISGAWNIDAENFMKGERLKKVLNRATLRATYGLVGSIGSATNSSTIFRSESPNRPTLRDKESIIRIESLGNDNLTWEKQYETNIGLDLGFFGDKLNLVVDIYKRNGFDLNSPYRTTAIGGQYVKNVNYADMETKGIEGTLSGTIINTKDLGWRTNLNFGYNKNKVTNLLGGQRTIFELASSDGGPIVGFPYRGLYSVDFQGLNHKTGNPEFINEKGVRSGEVNLESQQTQYMKYEGPTDPKLTGGFSNQLRYKSFTFSVLLTFASGNVVRLRPIFGDSYTDLDALPLEFKRRWALPGDEEITNIPSIPDRYNSNDISGKHPYNTYNYSSARVAKGDFLKLKTITLGYNLPVKWINTIGAKTASVTVVANNFYLIYADKKLNGQDPEFFASGGVALPIPKQYTLSLKVGF
ncbi:SusC/RagA family TonB-linked outer membrane protein [Pedobacter nototheniae]|uniref:SusC/RagA family TonB-linked outer membrane protein n=1 Tax=Pedobacter nototheniae TaxID=2488994 RepID=UPI00103C5B32|nr:SusC/RagA family TonB-linked outer membrane protein [Pedobacter nototheniae]